MTQGTSRPGGGKSKRAALLARLALAAVFLLAMAGVSIWVVRSFIAQPAKTVILLPEEAVTATANKPGGGVKAVKAPRQPRQNNGIPTFSGDVVDAATKQPIPKFSIRLGYGYNFPGNTQPVNFNIQPPKDFISGQFKIAAPFNGGTNAQWTVRIEAKGYLPVLSPPYSKTTAAKYSLYPGADLKGVVLSPAGSPVSGATVVMAIPGLQAYMQSESLSQVNQGTYHVVTDADGHFDLPPQLGPVALAAASEQGFGRIQQDASAKDWKIQESPWARIDGQLIIAGKPGLQQTIEINSQEPYDAARPQIFISTSKDTDGQGHFECDRVAPGPLTIGRMFYAQNGQYRNGYFTQSQPAIAVAGQTVTVQIGGAGRPVIGRLVLPPAAGKLGNYFVNQNVNGTTPPPPPPQMPDKVRNASPAARDMWMGLFRMTPAGRDYLAKHTEAQPIAHQYAMEIGPDGKFRIEDVVPGDYQVYVYLNVINGNGGGRNLQPGQMQFTMPPVPQGYSDQPLDIGDIKFRTN